MNWMIHERLPVDVTLEHLEQIEPLVIRQNAPCDKKAFCVILDDFWSFCETFGLGRNTTNDFEYYMKQATEIYWQTLQKIPEDLLVVAFQRIKKSWRFSKIPLPADISRQVEKEHCLRLRAMNRIRSAKLQLDSQYFHKINAKNQNGK